MSDLAYAPPPHLATDEIVRAETTLWRVLRVGAAMCFIGHGAFGIMTKEAWLCYFAVAGIGADPARALMPLIGGVDIALGLAALLSPRPIVFAYMAVWSLWTAMLRPLAGEPVWEVVERAGNYGVPAALLVMSLTPRHWREWLAPSRRGPLSDTDWRRLRQALIATTSLLLLGHGMLGVTGKTLLGAHYAAIGLSPALSPIVGWLEVAAAFALIARPTIMLALGIAAWKLATESLFLADGAAVWEVIERGGSYVAPLALAILLRVRAVTPLRRSVRARAAAPAAVLLLLFAPQRASAQAHAHHDSSRLFPLPARNASASTSDAELLRALREGGLVLACRHAHTDRSRNDSNGEDWADTARQRNLSDQGRAEAREIGRAIRGARIPIGEVWASPMWRTVETAQLAFGDATPTTRLRGSSDPQGQRSLFVDPVPPGTNRVLVTHTGTLIRILERTDLTPLPEGGCMVLRPEGAEGVTALGTLDPAEWAPLGGGSR